MTNQDKLDYVFNTFNIIKPKHNRTEGGLASVKTPERALRYNLSYGLILDYDTVLSQIPNIESYEQFIDMGSGVGRILLKVFLTTTITTVIGIELVNTRFEISKLKLIKLNEGYPEYVITINEENKIQIQNEGRTLTIYKKNIYEHTYDKTIKSIVNSHMLTNDLDEYKDFMNTFTNSFILTMYPLSDNSTTLNILTDWEPIDGYTFSLTNSNDFSTHLGSSPSTSRHLTSIVSPSAIVANACVDNGV